MQKILKCLVLAGMSSVCFAQQVSCPSLSAIHDAGLNYVEVNANGLWSAAQLNHHFNTNNQWTFYITQFHATNQEDALAQATAALTHLSVMGGPVGSGGMWICGYKTQLPQVIGYAVTPPMKMLNAAEMLSAHLAFAS